MSAWKPPSPPFAPCAPALARPCYQIPYAYPALVGEIKYCLRPCCPPCGGVEIPLPNYNPPKVCLYKTDENNYINILYRYFSAIGPATELGR